MSPRRSLTDLLGRALDGRTQADLARALGVSRSTVHLWASGKRPVPERYRPSLRAAARPGRSIPPPPPRTTRTGRPVQHAGSATVTPLPSGGAHVHTRARAAFARELARAAEAGRAPTSFSVQLTGFRAEDSPKGTPARTRRIQVRDLTSDEIDGLASGSRDALEDVITRAVSAQSYTGGFTFDRATAFDFDTP